MGDLGFRVSLCDLGFISLGFWVYLLLGRVSVLVWGFYNNGSSAFWRRHLEFGFLSVATFFDFSATVYACSHFISIAVYCAMIELACVVKLRYIICGATV